jgi:DNA-binding PadR family transcriptional regulator
MILLDTSKRGGNMFKDFGSRRERFFREFRRDSPFQKGDLKYVILNLLKEKPRYGYEIIRSLEESSHGFYTPSPGVVYPTLQMLEEMGYASSTDRDGKKVFTITEEGRGFLSERKDTADAVKDQMKHRWHFKNFAKMAMVMKEMHVLENTISRRMRHAEPEKLERVRAVISQAGEEIRAILEE